MSFSTMLSQMSQGMLSTLGIFVLTLLFSLPLGFLIGNRERNKRP